MNPNVKDRTIKLVINSSFSNVSLLGVAVRGICSYLSLGEPDKYYTELCVVEAVNNVIKHAYGLESGNSIEVEIFLSDECMVFKVRDTGKFMHFVEEGDSCDLKLENLQDFPENGLGLFLIRSLMDEAFYERVGTENVFTLKKELKKSRKN